MKKSKFKNLPSVDDFLGDGIYLVQTTPTSKSSQRIAKLSALPKLYPFAQMAVSSAELVKFLRDIEKRAQEKTGTYATGPVKNAPVLTGWKSPSHQDMAMEIMWWLAHQKTEDSQLPFP